MSSLSSARWKAFSAAEHLAQSNGDNAWEAPKNRGNEALKAGNFVAAAKHYRDAALLAMGPVAGGAFASFIHTLESFPAGSAQRQFVENEDLVWRSVLNRVPTPKTERRMELKDGKEMVAKYPNKGASIAWANRAQALLLAGRPKDALRSARRATEANPEYLKGHHREMKALEALGEVAAAAKVAKQMAEFKMARSLFPAESAALLSVGWITWERASLVYGPIRFRAAADAVAARDEKKVEARASIVPFEGGQMLMLTLVYGLNESIEAMDLQMVDHTNGNIADKPPHGHASPQALKYASTVIAKFIGELASWELETVALMCGQGLVDHVDRIDAELKAGVEGAFEPIDGVLVYASSSTAASEDSGVPAPTWGNQASMQAIMARLGL